MNHFIAKAKGRFEISTVFMIKNIGSVDKVIRIIIGLFLVYYAIANYNTSMVWSVIAGIVGLGLIITVFTGFCFLYKIFGISTKK